MTEPTITIETELAELKTYPVEDAQAILQLAIARQAEEGELTQRQLLEIGEELGISAATLAEAEQEWRLKRIEDAELAAFGDYKKQQFQSHLIRFVITNAVLLTLNYMTLGRFSWALYVLLVWSAAVGLHGWQTFQPNPLRYREEFEKWRRRQQLRRSFNRVVDWLLGS